MNKKRNIIIVIIIAIILILSSIFLFKHEHTENCEHKEEFSHLHEHTDECDHTSETPSADVPFDKILKFIKENEYLESKNLTYKDYKDIDKKLLKKYHLDEFITEGFMLVSDESEDFELVMVFTSKKDPMSVYELMSNYYLDLYKEGNTTHANTEQSTLNIKESILGLKGKYTYFICSKNAQKLSNDLTQLLKF